MCRWTQHIRKLLGKHAGRLRTCRSLNPATGPEPTLWLPGLEYRLLDDLCLERDWDEIAEQSTSNPVSRAQSRKSCLHHLYFRIDRKAEGNSGRTSLRRQLSAFRCSKHRIHRERILLSVTTISFDIAGLGALSAVIGWRPGCARESGRSFGRRASAQHDKIVSSGTTMMQATPSTWRLLLDAGLAGPGKFKILCGGEVLSRRLAHKLLEGGAGSGISTVQLRLPFGPQYAQRSNPVRLRC